MTKEAEKKLLRRLDKLEEDVKRCIEALIGIKDTPTMKRELPT